VKTQDVDLTAELDGLAEDCVQFDTEIESATDAVRTAEYFHRVGADFAIIDHYQADEAYQRVLLNAGLRWMQFDGAAQTPLWADWVVSMSPAADVDRYRALQRRPQTRLLLGPRYAILRDEFLPWHKPRQVNPKAGRLLLTFGGGDDRGACVACLDSLQRVGIFEITILSGGGNPQVPSIRSWIDRHASQQVQLFLDDDNVARHMFEADIAVTAGGTTTFETAMLGLPTLIIQIADNQRANAQAWDRMGVAVDLGTLEGLDPGRLGDRFASLAGNPLLRERMGVQGRAHVDGYGADRLVQELCPEASNIE
jgi:spore coat polysaccharide biosynthesis predicted glycosyltransferase SpsG